MLNVATRTELEPQHEKIAQPSSSRPSTVIAQPSDACFRVFPRWNASPRIVCGRDMAIPPEYSARSVASEGHDPGHPPAGLTWGDLVAAWRTELGGLTALAEELMRRAGHAELPRDLGSIERGLRRLGERGHQDGGQYGRWLDRFFGMPPSIESWVRWMGQYHRRFADLPVSLCRQQLAMWDRPPVRDSAAGAWIDLGVAS